VSDNEDARPSDGGAKRLGREAKPMPKRFYTAATVGERDGRYTVLLDGRVLKTSGKRELAVEVRTLAEAIAAEWAAQTDTIDPTTMPFTRLVNTAIDAVAARAGDVAADVVKYAGSDLLYYRASHPQALIDLQAKHWDPVLAWAEAKIGGRFILAEGVMHVAQAPTTLERIAEVVAPFDALRLTALHVMTTLMGSALLALAVAKRRLTADEAWAAAHVDEDWQISQWGEDVDASARRAARWRDMRAASIVALME
jgi:chaperone required for assembly of F1-ATPase